VYLLLECLFTHPSHALAQSQRFDDGHKWSTAQRVRRVVKNIVGVSVTCCVLAGVAFLVHARYGAYLSRLVASSGINVDGDIGADVDAGGETAAGGNTSETTGATTTTT
jgi:hypothetical protein